ncbi:hypothetical protein FRB99_007233, partial [Tulasnella sp. 403]
MQNALAIDELQRSVVQNIDEKQDLYNLARSSTLFTEPALDAMWNSIPTLEQVWGLWDNSSVHPYTFSAFTNILLFSIKLTEANKRKITQRTRRIGAVTSDNIFAADSNPGLISAMVKSLTRATKDQTVLLPNLQSYDCEAIDILRSEHLDILKHVLGPKLAKMKLAVYAYRPSRIPGSYVKFLFPNPPGAGEGGPPASPLPDEETAKAIAKDFAEAVAKKKVPLEELDIHTVDDLQQSHLVAVRELCMIPSLRSIKLTLRIGRHSLLTALGALPDLEHLDIDQDLKRWEGHLHQAVDGWFPNLRSIHANYTVIKYLFAASHSLYLIKSVRATFDEVEGVIPRESIEELFSTLGSSCPDLEKVWIDALQTSGQARNPAPLQLHDIAKCGQVRQFVAHLPLTVTHPRDEDIEIIAQAWPHLEELRWIPAFGRTKETQPVPTLRSIATLSVY